jgi:hypothetical protein
MYELINTSPRKSQPTLVALAVPCPARPWAPGQRSNLETLAERCVR